MTMQGEKTLNKNFLIAAGVLLVIGFAVAVGVTLSTEPLTAGLPEGETTVTGDPLPTYSGENDDNIAIGLSAPTFSGPNENSEIMFNNISFGYHPDRTIIKNLSFKLSDAYFKAYPFCLTASATTSSVSRNPSDACSKEHPNFFTAVNTIV